MSYKEVIYMHNLSFSSLTLKYISALALIGFLSVISFLNMRKLQVQVEHFGKVEQ